MLILTGGAGFIGTNMLIRLNQIGAENVLIVDNINTSPKWKNLVGQNFRDYLHKDALWDWLKTNPKTKIDSVIHLGACSNTTENDFDYLMQNNVRYSQKLWELCLERQIPFIYASSAATYGDGSKGFSDEQSLISGLLPVNAYGFSKHLFDLWVLQQIDTPPKWLGLKFFNVYGPYESYKNQMASVIYHGLPQVQNEGKLRLFKSYRQNCKDGEQKRDFIYVEDAIDVIQHMLSLHNSLSGIYNVGTGQATSFNQLAEELFAAVDKPVKVEYIDMPTGLSQNYQYFTQADIRKLKDSGFTKSFTSLRKRIFEYVEFLVTHG